MIVAEAGCLDTCAAFSIRALYPRGTILDEEMCLKNFPIHLMRGYGMIRQPGHTGAFHTGHNPPDRLRGRMTLKARPLGS